MVETRVNSILARFAGDLWLESFERIDQIIRELESLRTSDEGRSELFDKSQPSNPIDDHIRFFKFLKRECTGQDFSSDKQWSELMNAMQISRKLNHRSVRVKDLIQNRQLIEANKSTIRSINELAIFSRTIERLFSRLQASTSGCKLDLSKAIDQEARISTIGQKPIFIIEELSNAIDHLKNQCWPLLETLKTELRRDLVSRCPQLGDWTKSIESEEDCLRQINNLLELMKNFQSSLIGLSPLMDATNRNQKLRASTSNAGPHSSQFGQLTEPIMNCRREFYQIVEFNENLIKFIIDKKKKLQLTNKIRFQTRDKRDFSNVSDHFLPLIKLIDTNSNRLISDLLDDKLTENLNAVQECETQLNMIMQTIRLEFGRFYFINDLELLHLIALDLEIFDASSQQSLEDNQRLLKKLFDNSISGFIIENDNIIAIKSPIGEVLHLCQDMYVPIHKRVNVHSLQLIRILNEVLRKLRRTMKILLVESVFRQEAIDWSLPIQLIDLSERIKFTRRVEDAFNKGVDQTTLIDRLNGLINFYGSRFDRFSKQNSELPRDNESGIEANLRNLKRSACLSLTVSFVSVLMSLRSLGSVRLAEWNWFCQARYYIEKLEIPNQYEISGKTPEGGQFRVLVRITDTEFNYNFDYLPIYCDNVPVARTTDDSERIQNFKRLVWTKSTERCILSASQALNNWRMGANPFGPAGGGKTETIKTFGQLVGSQVIVHNCDDSNDSKSIERLIWGLAYCGLWGCFDEFNRLSLSALSSVSATLELVQNSLRGNKLAVEVSDGQSAQIDASCDKWKSIDQNSAFFVTLNPGDSNKYRGRRSLPANLRSLFFPIAMVDVHYESIVGEYLTILNSRQGLNLVEDFKFDEAIDIGDKVAAWIKSIKKSDSFKNLANSMTCEWDLRLIMAILRRLSILVEKNDFPTKELRELFIIAIQQEIEPRLPIHLLQELQSSIEKSFGLFQPSPSISSSFIETSLTSATEEEKCFCTSLHNQLETHQGVLLYGPTKSGKTTAWQLLRDSMNHERQVVECLPLNPRSCNKDALFGYVDPLSQKWSDGIFTWYVREALRLLRSPEQCLNQVWIIFDGPIDPDWVESLNSVLDDNQVLTLSSGERLNFVVEDSASPSGRDKRKSIKLLFESDSVEYVSPATISRLGVVQFPEGLARSSSPVPYTEEEPNKFIESDANLLIFTGYSTNLRQVTERLEKSYSKQTTDDGMLIGRYICSQSSNGQHLSDWILHHQKCRILFFENVHLIEPEDQWRAKSFIELLRFVLTYGYINIKETINFRKIITRSMKFVITCHEEHINRISSRLTRLANRIVRFEKTGVFTGHTEIAGDAELKSWIDHLISQDGPSITTLTTSLDFLDQNFFLFNILRENQNDIMCFSEERLVNKYLESLQELVWGQRSLNDRQHVFVLNSLEIKLMKSEARALLFHLLNYIRETTKRIKLIHVVDQNTSYVDELTFWQSIGLVYCYRPVTTQKLVELSKVRIEEVIRSEVLSLSNHNFVELNECQVNWLVDNINSIDSGKMLCYPTNNTRLLNSYIRLIVRLLTKFISKLTDQRASLQAGLECLLNFEQHVESIKLRCRDEDVSLALKKRNIEEVIKKLDNEIKRSKDQLAHLDEMRDKKGVKDKELALKSASIDKELEKVIPIVESSKIEVNSQLRPEALNEIKTLRSPPKTIQDILEVLFSLLKIKDRSWQSVKSYLSRKSFKDELLNYNFNENLSADLVNDAKNLISSRRESFDLERASRASSAIVPIVKWILATIAYGEALSRLKPLSDEMKQIKNDVELLREETHLIELKQHEVDLEISKSKRELDSLQNQYRESSKIAEDIKLRLDEAQKARSELNDQIARWHSRLNDIEMLLSGDQLARMCLSLASLAFSSIGLQDLSSICQLDKWLEAHKLLPLMGSIKYIVTALTLLRDDDEFATELILESQFQEDLGPWLKLVALRTIIDNTNDMIPFLDCYDQAASDITINLRKQLCQHEILASTESDIIVIDCSNKIAMYQASNKLSKQQEIRTHLSLNKLIVLNLGGGSIDLDMLNFLLSYSSLTKSIKSKGRLILAGSFEAQPDEFKKLLVYFPEWHLRGNESMDRGQIYYGILEQIVRIKNPNVAGQLELLKETLHQKRQDSRRLEARLLLQLGQKHQSMSTSNEASIKSSSNISLMECLVEMNKSSKDLNSGIESTIATLAELQRSSRHHEKLALEATDFYVEHIAALAPDETMYQLSYDEYTELLVAGLPGNEGKQFGLVCSSVMRMLKPEARRAFSANIGKYAANKKWTISVESVQLNKALEELTIHPSNQFGRGSRLAIIIHDRGKSTPQVEVDEYFRTLNTSANLEVNYEKLYATKNLDYHVLSSHLNSKSSPVKNLKTRLNVICIVNSHLGSLWLNENLNTMLDEAQSDNIVILIAEHSENLEYKIEPKLLSRADIKIWYDELNLNLIERFELLSKSSSIRNQIQTSVRSDPKMSSEMQQRVEEFTKEIILLHVVCQELNKDSCLSSGSDSKQNTWLKDYPFDMDHLSSALRTLVNLASKRGQGVDLPFGGDLRSLVSHYLESVVYGSQMESLEDENRLHKLIEMFFRCQKSASMKMSEFTQLKEYVTRNGTTLTDDQLCKFIWRNVQIK